MSFSAFQRIIRKTLILSIGILILLLGVILFALIKSKDDSLNSSLPSGIDCLNIIFSDSDILAEKSLESSLKIRTSCFCINGINTYGLDAAAKLFLSDNSNPCANYVSLYTDYNNFKLLVAIGISMLNLLFVIMKSNKKINKNLRILKKTKLYMMKIEIVLYHS